MMPAKIRIQAPITMAIIEVSPMTPPIPFPVTISEICVFPSISIKLPAVWPAFNAVSGVAVVVASTIVSFAIGIK